jgi:maleamate amidohydrolase
MSPNEQFDPSQPWLGVVSETDAAVYRAAGFGRPAGMGRRPALLVIDTQYRTVGTTPRPILEAIKEYPTSCGEAGWLAISHIARMIDVFRTARMPVIYPHVAVKTGHDGGRFADKVPAIMSIDAKGYQFVREVAPVAGDILVPKHHPSAFFGTPLASYLVNLAIDTLVVTGCTTSGCVRASTVDAFAFGYRVVVPIECVYDRAEVSHAVNLFDMSSKYADVLPVDAVAVRIAELAAQRERA